MLETTIVDYIEQHSLLPRQGTVVVAVSGGADSLCLLHVLQRLCGPGKQYADVQLHVAHLNHQLRGIAGEHDAALVARIAESWDLPVTIGTIDVPTLAREEQRSLEEAARVARYRFLRDVAQGQPIAVAHHMDDQVETLLLHWLRGGGLASMVGLQPRQRDIIRPLLAITHADTLVYCAQNGIEPVEDASNFDPRFVRNRIRHELIPLLEAMNPAIRETLLRNAEVMHVDFSWLESQVDAHWSEVVALEQSTRIQLRRPALLALPLSLQRHLMRRATAQLCDGQSPLELRHYRLIELLIQRERADGQLSIHLPQHLQFVRSGAALIFEHMHGYAPAQVALPANEETVLTVPGSVAVAGTSWIARADLLPAALQEQVQRALQGNAWSEVWHLLPVTATTVYVDADRLCDNDEVSGPLSLRVRTRRAGDRIQPLGMAHEKKVQDILVDKHIPRSERASIPLFFAKKHCVWLAGIHLSERARLTAETRRIVRLAIVQAEQ